MPIVHVELWPGRSKEVKQKVAQEITDSLVKNVGCPVQSVTVVFNEIPAEEWMIAGKMCAQK
jgi:4-oxalocrotonate tautomerase